MKRTLCLLLGLCLVTPALAQEEGQKEASAEGQKEGPAEGKKEASSEGKEILKKTDAAIKKVEAVRYKAKATATGAALRFLPAPAEGTVVMSGWENNNVGKLFCDVTTQKADSSEKVHLTIGGNGETFFLIDHAAKMAYEDMDPAVIGTRGGVARGLAMPEYVHPTPFDDEINAESAELEGTESVEGEDCYKIRVVYGGRAGVSIWYVSKKDYLPRRRDRLFEMPSQEESGKMEKGAFQVVLKDLEINPQVDDAMFTCQLPEGYEKTDEFAP